MQNKLRTIPGFKKIGEWKRFSLSDSYDLFFAICGSPTELIRVAALGDDLPPEK
jgi:hypothetical protein